MAVTTAPTTAAPTPYEPVPLIAYAPPEPIPLDADIPGTTSCKSSRSLIIFVCISSALKASTEIARS